ncbi:hypothetical protein CDL15_Pgr015166 [Punica granatum]|uniref:2-oxoacid dehydrogenase acyltransferase catalytic domain-containing protein n=1 Tax=Punica granatum TaxID=22663 RepID=A0A218W0U3_PUNGR|nr:hypothetical protein CDL15_Pgr015166 [Punica granatum]
MTALLAKATARALVKRPVVNSSCRDGKSFTYNSNINIAVAVAMDGGLITPDIFSVSRKFSHAQGAIMAVGASHPTVVASKDGRIGMKNQMQVNVTADHRVIYEADLASFLQSMAKIIDDPKDLTF